MIVDTIKHKQCRPQQIHIAGSNKYKKVKVTLTWTKYTKELKIE